MKSLGGSYEYKFLSVPAAIAKELKNHVTSHIAKENFTTIKTKSKEHAKDDKEVKPHVHGSIPAKIIEKDVVKEAHSKVKKQEKLNRDNFKEKKEEKKIIENVHVEKMKMQKMCSSTKTDECCVDQSKKSSTVTSTSVEK